MTKFMHKRSLLRIGITPHDYQTQGDLQEWKCAICGVIPDEKLCADHNHANGKFRGLLCQRCNRAIGLLKDSIDILSCAISYIEKDGEAVCQKICLES